MVTDATGAKSLSAGKGMRVAMRNRMSSTNLEALSDEELLASAQCVYRRSREITALLVRHLVLIEERRLHLKAAYPSLYEFCVREWGMSNSSASRHSTAAKLAAKYPQILERLSANRLHMSTLVRMKHFIDDDTVDELLDLIEGKSRYEIDELLADLSPEADMPSRMRKLPEYRTRDSFGGRRRRRDLEPMGDARYRVEFTADRELRDAIEHVRDLMRYTNPTGELLEIIRFCVRAGLDLLKRRRMGVVRSPRSGPDGNRPRLKKTKAVPAAVRRAVFARDGEQCTYHDESGKRCCATTLLELDHIISPLHGGLDTVENLRVRCFAHNRLHAEEVFGKAYITKCIARARGREETNGGANGAANA